ncbi:hypothetical protein CQA38_07935 [Campylobacter sp. MIT 12-5580]|uniref:hypothetical protein n=1 Tax=unclassified Campylobacter TaxID=2593542 RepID=UPI0010F5FD88|nr:MULTISPECIES: hypothetical protein [unclassified Campylobacter]NDJ27325.1 hypothetical protein [Campylobacter sp. MIT 19-121]TKX28433.1 hypothetical protein CQA38_07935 [Campylobacter sp. MIT 12-5580]
MRIKLFIFSGLLYLVLLGAFVYHVSNAEFTLMFGGYEFTLPVVVWVVLPVVFLFVCAILHMSFYTFLRYLKTKDFYSDARKFQHFALDLLLEKNPKPHFKIKEFQNAAELVKSLKTFEKIPNNDKLNEVLDILSELKEQKSVNLKKFKLDQENPLVQLNEKNTILNDINYAFLRLKNKKEFQNELDLIAFEELLKLGTFKQIQSLSLHKNAQQITELFKRFEQGNLQMNNQEFESLLNEAVLSEKQYLDIAKLSTKKLDPDSLIAIFKKLKEQNSDALKAYLFILAEFGLFDELRLELKMSSKEYEEFNIILLAREHHKKVDFNTLVQ